MGIGGDEFPGERRISFAFRAHAHYNSGMNPEDTPPPKLMESGPKLTLKDRKAEVAPPVERHLETSKSKKRKRRKQNKDAKITKPGSGAWQSVLAFFVVAAVLGGFLWHQVNEKGMVDYTYLNLGRIVVVGGLFVVLLLDAFSQDMIQGLLCVFFAPYAFVYGLLFADAGPLRGFTTAVVVFLGAEIYFTPNDAMTLHARDWVTNIVGSGQGLIMDEPRREAGFE